jgi:hypothetical protein
MMTSYAHIPYKNKYSKIHAPFFTGKTDFNEFTCALISHMRMTANSYLISVRTGNGVWRFWKRTAAGQGTGRAGLLERDGGILP